MKKVQRDFIRQMHTVDVQYKHRGLSCPLCGYTYNNGFTDVTKPMAKAIGDKSPILKSTASYTVCTQCLEPFILKNGQLEHINKVDQMLLSDKDRVCLDNLRAMLVLSHHSKN